VDIETDSQEKPLTEKKPAPSIDAHLMRDYRRTERKYLVTHARPLLPRSSLRHRLSKLNQPGGMFNLSGNTFNPNLKIWAVLFLVLAFGLGGFAWVEAPGNGIFHHIENVPCPFVNPAFNQPTVRSCNDPITQLWAASSPNNDLSEFNSVNSAIHHNCLALTNCMEMTPTSSNPSVAISKTSVDLSSVSGKEFLASITWGTFAGTCCGIGIPWMFFLRNTVNSTLPTESSYNPRNDPNVALIIEMEGIGSGNYQSYTFIQRTPGSTIASQDTGNCAQGSDCFIQEEQNGSPVNTLVVDTLDLNFTGVSNNGSCNVFTGLGSGCSYLVFGNGSGGFTNVLPWLPFQGVDYNIGFYETANAPMSIDWGFNDGTGQMALFNGVYTAPSNPPVVAPTIDTGGFFGPIIKALIAIGVFIIANIIKFFAYLWSILQPIFTTILNLLYAGITAFATLIVGFIKSILNAIGSGLGISNLGDNIFTFLGDIGSFFSTFFGNALAQLSSFITFLTNGYTTISSTFSTYWTDLTNWTTGLKDFLAGLWVIGAQYFTIGFAFMFSGWLLFGAYKFSREVNEGMEWFNLTRQFLMMGVAVALFLLTILIHYVIIPGFHAVQATGEAKKTAEPDIEIGGTGVG
jgi:hypothetical protein